MKTVPVEAALVDALYNSYVNFLLLAIPTRPSSPEPNIQTAGGIGIGVIRNGKILLIGVGGAVSCPQPTI